ncbi:hypothetical protein MHH56_27060 [Paenibacillus sp. FSL K6-3182]|uniref:hypothetical protein n=1 Tax=Paenibacillus sp. FSL K6-3182 TaxID=2921495 RepID=UPI0030D3F076
MRTFILIGCLIGGIFAYTGDIGQVTATYSPVTASSPVKAIKAEEATQEIVIASASPSTVTEVTYAAESTLVVKAKKPKFTLQTVNGITLYDDPSLVIQKLGKPKSKTADPDLTDLITYEYPNMNVIFSSEFIQSVEMAENTKTLLIDGSEVAATVDAVKDALGEPDYVTEDGIVFERDEALLKLFIDADTQKLTSIHYFHSFSM